MNIVLEKATFNSQYQKISRLHAAGITEGFLSSLGTRFLASLYKGISSTLDSGVIIALNSNNPDLVLGFISYSKDVKICYKQVLKKRFFQLAFAMIPNLFKVSVYKKVFETLLYPFYHKDTDEDVVEVKTGALRPELLSMAVSENARGKGIGKMLVKAVDEKMKEMGVDGYYVVTHGVDERSNGFYKSCGFEKVQEFESHGKPMNEYYKKF